MPKHLPLKKDILSFIKDSPSPVTKRDIARAFSIKGSERIALKQILKKMTQNGMIEKDHRKGYKTPDGLPNVTIVKFIAVDKKNLWLAEPETWHENTSPPRIVVKPKSQQNPVGSKALVRLERISEKEYKGHIIKHFAKNNGADKNTIIGVITVLSDGSAILTPAERGKKIPVQISKHSLNGAKNDDLVIVKNMGKQSPEILKILGKQDNPKLLSLISIHQNGIPNVFPSAVLKETETMNVPTNLKNRIDLRNIPLVTIDGADARDFDDAVFAEPDSDPKNIGGWHLIVSIADVSYYVRPKTALNEHAYERGNSTYFPDRVVPMLPEKLSNDLCSLRPNEPRACLAVHLWIDKKGDLVKYKFIRGLMQSHARLTYEQVEQAYNGNPDKDVKKVFESVIKPLYAAYDILKKARNKRGALDIDLPEYQVNINKEGHIDGITKRMRLTSHKLIEEFMVLANIAAAKALEEHKTTAVYRIHPKPDAAKLSAVHGFFKNLGHDFGKQASSTPKDLNTILHKVKNLDIAHLANTIILRSQSKAIYHTENQGHFGLSLTHYTHFTSPIRRYADLLVHRALVKTFKLGEGGQTEDEAVKMPEMAEHISETERRSMLAERSSMDRYTALYLAEHIGAEFEATINGMSKAGLFISLKDCGSDGFIPARTLPNDQYIHDETKHALVGRRTKREFQLCAPIMARLVEVEPIAGSTVFALTQHRGKPIPISSTRNSKYSKNKRFSRKKNKKNKKRR